jgi:protoporphyrinogen IX oxidase
MSLIQDYYLSVKALHIIAMTAWMAGLFYLPRLFAYHTDVRPDSEAAKLFIVMERRLLKIIMNPALILTFVFGGLLAMTWTGRENWLIAKLVLVLLLAGFHGFLSHCRRALAENRNRYSSQFYRMINEVPTLLLIGIIFLVVLKP